MAAIKVQIAQRTPIKLKFTWNDHCDILNIATDLMYDVIKKQNGRHKGRNCSTYSENSNLHGMVTF